MSELAVFGSIAGATVAWALAEVVRGVVPRAGRLFWTVGAFLAVIHSAAAFGVFHAWSHEAALVATAQQTAAVTGLDWGGGLYINYAFLVIWTADALWWWTSPDTYETRPAAVSMFVRGFLFFMFVNGAVIFADGWMRVLGIAAIVAVSAAWYRSHRTV